MSESDSSRGRLGDQPPLKIVGDVIDALVLRARLSQVGLEVLGEPFIEPERQIAERATEQGMRRFVTQVFLEARARVSVDDALAALCQEKRSPRRQLGIIELEKMGKCVAIIEDVDLDRIVVEARSKIEMFLHVALECLQAAHGRWIVGHREVREDDERSGSKLVARRHERLPVIGERRAARERKQDRNRPEGDRPTVPANRPMVPAIRHCSSPVRSGKWPPASQVTRSLAANPLLDRPPEALPVVKRRQAPGKVKAEESEEVGPVSPRYRIQTDAETRQVLDAPIPGDRMSQMNPDQINHAELDARPLVASALIRMFEAFRSRCESDRSWRDRISSASDTVRLRIRARRTSGGRLGSTLRA